MDDIATLQKMIKHIHVQVAPQLVLQEVQGLANMATICFTRLAWLVVTKKKIKIEPPKRSTKNKPIQHRLLSWPF